MFKKNTDEKPTINACVIKARGAYYLITYEASVLKKLSLATSSKNFIMLQPTELLSLF